MDSLTNIGPKCIIFTENDVKLNILQYCLRNEIKIINNGKYMLIFKKKFLKKKFPIFPGFHIIPVTGN